MTDDKPENDPPTEHRFVTCDVCGGNGTAEAPWCDKPCANKFKTRPTAPFSGMASVSKRENIDD